MVEALERVLPLGLELVDELVVSVWRVTLGFLAGGRECQPRLALLALEALDLLDQPMVWYVRHAGILSSGTGATRSRMSAVRG